MILKYPRAWQIDQGHASQLFGVMAWRTWQRPETSRPSVDELSPSLDCQPAASLCFRWQDSFQWSHRQALSGWKMSGVSIASWIPSCQLIVALVLLQECRAHWSARARLSPKRLTVMLMPILRKLSVTASELKNSSQIQSGLGLHAQRQDVRLWGSTGEGVGCVGPIRS